MSRALIFAAAIALAACGSPTPSPRPEPRDDALTEAANGSAVTLARGETLALRLRSNATTGYRWQVAERPQWLRAAGDSYEGPRPGPGGEVANGAGGAQLLRFVAEGAGEGTLRLEYRGPGEAARVAGTFQLQITAR